MKFYYVVVAEGYKTHFSKQCINVGEANTLLAEKKKEYPDPKYSVTREYY